MHPSSSSAKVRHGLTIAYHTLLATFIVATCVFIYACSPLREHIENRLSDIRTRLARTTMTTDAVAVVTISESDIEWITGHNQTPLKDLDYTGLGQIVHAISKSQASNIVVLLHAQVFSYDDHNGLTSLARLAAADPRMIIGTNRMVSGDAGNRSLPRPLRRVEEQVGDIEATRTYRRDIVREMVVTSRESTPYLLQRLAERLGLSSRLQSLASNARGERVMRLNYFDPASILTLRAQDIVQGRDLDQLAGRTVFIGYSAFRPWSDALLDATHLHSPWESEAAEVDETSMPLVIWHAEALVNLIEGVWLEQANSSTVITQVLVAILLTLSFWFGTIGFACLLFIGGWALFMIVNAYYFAAFSLYIPLADTLIASVGAMVFGAILRLRVEGRHRAQAEARASSLAELASIQQHFLDRFTQELSSVNQRVRELIAFSLPAETAPMLVTSHQRLQQSCQEFDEYLSGLGQLRAIDRNQRHQPTLVSVNLEDAVLALIRQFDTDHTPQTQRFVLTVSSDRPVRADAYLVRQILYNFISNAIKYSPPSGMITIRIEEHKDQLQVSVTDEGPGIAPEFQAQIFEKFYRVKDDNVYKIKGHGLGLYLCRFFADQMGASINVVSSVGHGATFTLNLPALKAKEQP